MNILTALDRPATHQAATWSPDLAVIAWWKPSRSKAPLPEPKGPRRSSASAWPTMAREFEDVVGWATEAREAVWAIGHEPKVRTPGK